MKLTVKFDFGSGGSLLHDRQRNQIIDAYIAGMEMANTLALCSSYFEFWKYVRGPKGQIEGAVFSDTSPGNREDDYESREIVYESLGGSAGSAGLLR